MVYINTVNGYVMTERRNIAKGKSPVLAYIFGNIIGIRQFGRAKLSHTCGYSWFLPDPS
jgi:hypothetical protein